MEATAQKAQAKKCAERKTAKNRRRIWRRRGSGGSGKERGSGRGSGSEDAHWQWGGIGRARAGVWCAERHHTVIDCRLRCSSHGRPIPVVYRTHHHHRHLTTTTSTSPHHPTAFPVHLTFGWIHHPVPRLHFTNCMSVTIFKAITEFKNRKEFQSSTGGLWLRCLGEKETRRGGGGVGGLHLEEGMAEEDGGVVLDGAAMASGFP